MFERRQRDQLYLRDRSGRDLLLCVLVLLLAFGGLLLLQPISAIFAQRIHQDPTFFVKKQALWLVLGLGGMLFFAALPLAKLARLAPLFMFVSIVALFLVFVPGLGKGVVSSYGTFNRWLQLGPFRLQPSEFSKIALICYMAQILSRMRDARNSVRKLLLPAILVGVMLLAILSEPQYGTTICMLLVILLMVYSAGFPLLRLLLLCLSFVPLLALLVFFWQYRLERIYVWLDPYAYRFEGGYQLVTAFRAFQEGSWLGQELATGLAHRYLTYGHTDFAFALFAESFGWLGVCLFLLLLGAFVWRSIYLLVRINDVFACLLGSGALLMLLGQSLLNLFVVTGLVPTTGVGLPFLSYGGSLLVTSLCLCGILINATAMRTAIK